MTAFVQIARCPEHGLHGERDECFVCGGAVDQVAMVPLDDYQLLHTSVAAAIEERDRIRRLFNRLEAAVTHHFRSDHWKEEVDSALYHARDRILSDYAEGKG